MNRAYLITGLILIGYAHGMGSPTLDPGVIFRHVSCCRNDFTLRNILRAVPLSGRTTANTRFTVVTENEPHAEFGGFDISWEAYKRVALKERAEGAGIAYILESPTGAGAMLWNPAKMEVEQKVLRGKNPFFVPPAISLLFVGPDWKPERKEIVAWAWTQEPLNLDAARNILKNVRQHLGVHSVGLYIGDSPYLWTAYGFPLLVPAFGFFPPNEMTKARKPVIFWCEWKHGTQGPTCAKYIE